MLMLRFLECVNDKFITQMVEEPLRRGVLLNLMLTNEAFIEDVKVKGNLG